MISEGIHWPTSQGLYEVLFSIDTTPNPTIGSTILEVYPPDWDEVLFRSHISNSGEWNLIDVLLSPTTTISA